jgi:hypothetical protein
MERPDPPLCERLAHAFAADSTLDDGPGWVRAVTDECLRDETSAKARVHLLVVGGSLTDDAEPIVRSLVLQPSSEALEALGRVRSPEITLKRFATREAALEEETVQCLLVQVPGGGWLAVHPRSDTKALAHTPMSGWWWGPYLVVKVGDLGEGTTAHGSVSEGRHWILRRAAARAGNPDDDEDAGNETWRVVLDLQTSVAATGRSAFFVGERPQCRKGRVFQPTHSALQMKTVRPLLGRPWCSPFRAGRLFPAGRILRSWLDAIGENRLP